MTALPVKTQSPTGMTPNSDPSLGLLKNALGWVSGQPVLMTGRSITPEQTRALQQRQLTLRSQLSCGGYDDQEKAVEIAKLLALFPAARGGQGEVSDDLRTESYFDAVSGLPGWAVGQARRRIASGDTEYGRPWGPTPIQLADLVREIVRPVQNDLNEINALLIAEPIERAVDEAEHERVGAGLEALRDEIRPRVTAMQVREDAELSLKRRATALGLDYEKAMAAIPDQPRR